MIYAGLLLALALPAQDIGIDADRPHVGTGTHVVDRQEVQVELGVQWQRSTDAVVFGSPALVRIGLADRIEFRLSSDGLLARRQSTADAYGIGNAQIGAKVRLWGSRDEPVFSVLPAINLGVASREKGLGSGANDVSVTLLAGHAIPGRLHLEGNYGVGAIGDPDGRFVQHLLTGAVVHQTTGRVQTYVEGAWWSRQQREAGMFSFVDYGVIAALGSRLLFDAGGFTGLTPATPDWGLFSGVSFAFGGHGLHKQLRRGARADRERSILPAQLH